MIVSGRLELHRVSDNKEELIALCGPGMFTGELSLLSGRRALVRIRAGEASELIEIEREALRGLVQTDSELSDIFLRAFILRRLELIARGILWVRETRSSEYDCRDARTGVPNATD